MFLLGITFSVSSYWLAFHRSEAWSQVVARLESSDCPEWTNLKVNKSFFITPYLRKGKKFLRFALDDTRRDTPKYLSPADASFFAGIIRLSLISTPAVPGLEPSDCERNGNGVTIPGKFVIPR